MKFARQYTKVFRKFPVLGFDNCKEILPKCLEVVRRFDQRRVVNKKRMHYGERLVYLLSEYNYWILVSDYRLYNTSLVLNKPYVSRSCVFHRSRIKLLKTLLEGNRRTVLCIHKYLILICSDCHSIVEILHQIWNFLNIKVIFNGTFQLIIS